MRGNFLSAAVIFAAAMILIGLVMFSVAARDLARALGETGVVVSCEIDHVWDVEADYATVIQPPADPEEKAQHKGAKGAKGNQP